MSGPAPVPVRARGRRGPARRIGVHGGFLGGRRAAPAAALALVLASLPPGTASAGVRALVASGLGGDADYAEAFARDAGRIGEALGSLDATPGAVTVLEAPTREALLEALDERVADSDGHTLALVLVGHGTVDPGGYRFNLPGPDLGADDLVAALGPSAAARELVVVATSASGALLDVLGQPGRALVTATKSGGELNAVRFAEHFAEAVAGTEADIDRNEILTLGEAFRHADAATRRWYEDRNLLASEHARLEGEGAGALALARLGALAAAGDDPAVAALLDERSDLEAELEALRADKGGRAAADYWAELEAVLLRIARLQLSIDAATGWSEGDA